MWPPSSRACASERTSTRIWERATGTRWTPGWSGVCALIDGIGRRSKLRAMADACSEVRGRGLGCPAGALRRLRVQHAETGARLGELLAMGVHRAQRDGLRPLVLGDRERAGVLGNLIVGGQRGRRLELDERLERPSQPARQLLPARAARRPRAPGGGG